MNRQLIIVRTHRASPDSFGAYDRFLAAGFDVIFCVDERAAPVDMQGRTKIGYDADSLSAMGLYVHSNCGWRCGDYNYHVVREQLPDYDFYWLIEPDVRINTAGLAQFFQRFAETTCDYLAPRFGPRGSRWIWSQTVRPMGLQPHGGLFPITRMSGRAIDHVHQLRRTWSADAAIANEDAWPNDEAMAASALASAGFTCRDLNDGDLVCHSTRSFATGAVIDYRVVEAAPPDEMIYHPVRDFDAWLDTAEKRVATHSDTLQGPRGASRMRAQAVFLNGVARACLGHPIYADAALVPLILAQGSWAGRPWAESPAYASGYEDADRQELEVSTSSLQRRFGVSEKRPRIGTAHTILARHGVGRLTTAGPEDFDIDEGISLGRIPARFLLPFAYDLVAGDMLLTAHVQSSQLLTAPFLYEAQRETARVLVRLPIASLPRVFAAPPPATPPVFILSLGRTGSTLLGKLIGCVTARSISEPDIVTQLAAGKAALKTLPAEQRQRLLRYAIVPFFDVHLCDDPARGRCVIKFRSQVNPIADLLAAAFPAAKFVFMVRARHAWALSTYRAFGPTPERAVAVMIQGLRTALSLRRSGVDLTLIRYEDVLADPAAAISRIIGDEAASIADLRQRVEAIMQQDSQADHRLARNKVRRHAERERIWLKVFDMAWEQDNPAGLLAELGVTV